EQKGVDSQVVRVAEEALRSLLPEPEVDVRCVVSRYTKTPHAFGVRTKDSARVFVALDTSWRRSVLGESAVSVGSHFVLRLNPMYRRAWSGQVLTWAGEGEVKWVEVRQARFTRAHAKDNWSMELR
ncbi:MAG TPA: hypothetical protein VND22_03365, partial [Actinomycetota bacterium]|nr:hypothetical protein [Actinomycetota bacterium]